MLAMEGQGQARPAQPSSQAEMEKGLVVPARVARGIDRSARILAGVLVQRFSTMSGTCMLQSITFKVSPQSVTVIYFFPFNASNVNLEFYHSTFTMNVLHFKPILSYFLC